jgi:hypothetical protein
MSDLLAALMAAVALDLPSKELFAAMIDELGAV